MVVTKVQGLGTGQSDRQLHRGEGAESTQRLILRTKMGGMIGQVVGGTTQLIHHQHRGVITM